MLFVVHGSESLRVDCSGSSHQQLIDKLRANRLLTLPHVEHTLRAVDRAHFIPAPPSHPTTPDPSYYYRDAPRPIGSLATIASPSAHCIALQALFPSPPAATDRSALRCLDIGSGSGYLTLCLGLLAGDGGRVWGVEHAEALVAAAGVNVERVGYGRLLDSGRLAFVAGDGMLGLPSQQPFDVIHCGAAVEGAAVGSGVGEVAGRLLRQLRDGGVLLIPEITTPSKSGNGGSKSKWSFTFTAASQSLNLYQRLPASDAATNQQPSASQPTASSSPLPPYTVRCLMHCSYAPMRPQPPPADIDSLASFEQHTERLSAEVSECERQVKHWHQQWKTEKGRGATETDRAADGALQTVLREWRAKSVQLVERRQIEAQLQHAADNGAQE